LRSFVAPSAPADKISPSAGSISPTVLTYLFWSLEVRTRNLLTGMDKTVAPDPIVVPAVVPAKGR